MGIAGSPLRERVLFVTGSPRSGTTWVARILGSHPQVAAADDETHLFDRGVNALFDNHESPAEWERWLAGFVSREELVDIVRDLCDAILLRMRERTRPNAAFVVEKTPVAGLVPETELRRKLEVYPDAWYLHVVRDGRAVARSLLEVPWGPASASGGAELWRRSVLAVRAVLGPSGRYREVRYEDLFADPARGFGELLDWAGIGPDPAVESALAANRDVALAAGTAGARVEPDRWREDLSAAEVGAVDVVAGALLAELGYGEDVPSAPPPPQPIPAPDTRAAVQALVEAVRDRSAASIVSATAPSLSVRLRTGGRDADLTGDEARRALAELGREAFAGAFPRSGWIVTADGQWGSVWFSGEGGGRRTDLALLARVRDGLVDTVLAIVPGDPSGRPIGRM